MDRCNELSRAMFGITNLLDVLLQAQVLTDYEYDRIHAAIWGVVVDAKNRQAELLKKIEEATPL